MKREVGGKRSTAIALVLVMVISSLAILPSGSSAAEDGANPTRGENVLNIAIQSDISTLNPCKASDVWSWDVIRWFYDSPVRRSKDMENIPWMAENWTYSPDNPTWANLTLKDDIKWHDGEPFTGNDLVFTYNFFAGTDGYGAQVPRYLSPVMPLIWDNDSDGTPDWVGVWVDKNDPYTVHFHLSKPYAYFLSDTLSTIVLPEHIWKDHTGEDKFSWPTDPADYKNATVGTGLFKFSTWNKTQYAEIVANEDYFAGWPNVEHIDRIYFRIYQSTDSAIMALQNGEIDYIAWNIPPGYIPQLVENPQVTISQTDEPGYLYMGWNLREEPFNLLPFRQAMAHCTDKETMVSRLLLNYGSVGTSVISPANAICHNDSVTTYDYDLDAARQILDAQGWNDTDGDGWRELPGIGDREIVILTPPQDYNPCNINIGQMVADSCKEIGLNVIVKPTDFGTIFTKVYDDHDFDAYILGGAFGVMPEVVTFDSVSSDFDIFGGSNGIGLHNDTLDSMIHNMTTELNETKRVKICKDIQESIAYNLYYNVLYYRANLEIHRNDKYIGWYGYARGIFNFWTLWELYPGCPPNMDVVISGPEKVSEGQEAQFAVKLNDWTGAPIQDAEVTISATAGNITPSGSITTDEYGIAHFTYDAQTGLEYGNAPLVVSLHIVAKKGVSYAYRIIFLTVYPPDQDLATACIDLLQTIATTEEMKNEGVEAVVTISDQNGEPIEGATFDVEVSPSELSLTMEGNRTTDENGQSIITIKAPEINTAKDFIITIIPAVEGYSSGRTNALLTVVYVPPTMELAITISPESAKVGDDISITVTVTDSHTGEPLKNVSIELISSELNTTFVEDSGKTNGSGVFKTGLAISDIDTDSETVMITVTANLTGYAEVSGQKSLTLSREKSTPNISFIAIMGILGVASMIAALRRKRR